MVECRAADIVGSMQDTSLHLKARLAGLLFLIVMAAGIFAEYRVWNVLIVFHDPAATARNILTNEPLYRLGFAANLIDYSFYLGVTAILYELLKPVGSTLSVAAAAFSMVATAIVAAAALCTYAPLILLHMQGNEPWQALALLCLKLRTVGYDVSLVFFGLHFVLIGLLILRANFLPSLLGVLQMICGACYLINSFASVLSPPFARELSPYILMPCIVAELALALWLLFFGRNFQRSRAQTT